jgi:Helix-turn-helix domain
MRRRLTLRATLRSYERGGASKRTIERCFRVETKLTFGRWWQQLSLLHAIRLLAASDNVTTVALEVGYATSAFIAMFRGARRHPDALFQQENPLRREMKKNTQGGYARRSSASDSANRSPILAGAVIVLAACSTASSSDSNPMLADAGAYQCTVVQIRSDGCGSCGEAHPPGVLTDLGIGATFSMTVAGTTVDVPDGFTCSGSWNGSTFTCTITGCGGVGCCSCDSVAFVLMAADPDPSRTLAPGQIYAGIPFDNSWNAHCGH